MRTIQITTDVFAKIWSHRIEGEEDENAILRRLLGVAQLSAIGRTPFPAKAQKHFFEAGVEKVKIRWRDDVKSALIALGGEAILKDLYAEVRQIRLKDGRTLPANVEAIVRRELEYNSSSSHAFTGKFDWFRSVDGIGGGRWALREEG